MTRKDTLVLRDAVFLEHDPGPGHPENAARLQAVFDDLDRHAVPGTRCAAPVPAAAEQLRRVHSAGHVERVAASAGRPRVQLDPDTATSERSYEAARRAAGAALTATEATLDGSADGAFALVRPPGHHAEADAAMGFCLFNNVAVAAAHAVAELDCRRVLVLDPDVHHGNGTQHAFWDRADVLYVSSHRWPFYPGTGAESEIGAGPGAGFNVNLPLPAGMGDGEYAYVYRAVVDPIVAEYEPDLILVSAGFDTWHRDPLGGMAVTAEGFAALAGLFQGWAARHCPGRLVFALEGGYDPAGVIAGVRSTLEVVTGARTPPEEFERPVAPAAVEVAERVRRRLAPHWAGLRS